MRECGSPQAQQIGDIVSQRRNHNASRDLSKYRVPNSPDQREGEERPVHLLNGKQEREYMRNSESQARRQYCCRNRTQDGLTLECS